MIYYYLIVVTQDFWDYWETYKCLVETSNNPEYLLIVDAWQQLKFLELAQLRKLETVAG